MFSPLLLLILDLLLEEDGVLQEVRGVGHPPGGLALARPHHAQPILRLHVRRAQLSPVKYAVLLHCLSAYHNWDDFTLTTVLSF